MRARQAGWVVFLTWVCAVAPAESKEAALPPKDLLTVAELSGFTRTCRSADVVTLVDRLCARSAHLERFTFGKTFEDKPMVCVKVARPMAAGPAALANDPRPVVLVIGNIHSGECCGKEALLMLLRDLALNSAHPWLDDVVLLVVPNYNADGNDRFGPNDKHRKKQVGPIEMGTRANAQGLDLNRDFVKLASPEARALVGLMNAWNPHLFIDCHTTNGSWHRYQLTYDVPHNPASPPSVRRLLRDGLLPAVTETLEAKGVPTFYYGNFDRDHTKWTTYGHQPRYSTEYYGLRGRLAILSEAYSYIPFKDRILATKAFVEACVSWVRGNAVQVRAAVSNRHPRKRISIAAKPIAFPQPVTVRGYEPVTTPGTKPTVPKDYEVAFVGDYESTKSVATPACYVLPASQSHVAQRLQRHGIDVQRLEQSVETNVRIARIESATRTPRPFQGVHLLRDVRASWRLEKWVLPTGSLVVRTAGPLGALAVYLLEPESDDGFVTWGAFEGAFRVEADFPVFRLPQAPRMQLRPLAR